MGADCIESHSFITAGCMSLPRFGKSFFDFDGGTDGNGFILFILFIVVILFILFEGGLWILMVVVRSVASRSPYVSLSSVILVNGYGACCTRRMCFTAPFVCRTSVRLLRFMRYGRFRVVLTKSYICTPWKWRKIMDKLKFEVDLGAMELI